MSDDFESRFLKPLTRRFESPEVEIDCFRAEFHVAQQRRRDKLRILLNSSIAHYPQNILIQSKQLSRDSAANVNLSPFRSVNCDNTMFSEMLDFSMNTHVLLSSKDAVLHPEADADHSGRSVGSEYTVLPNSSQAVSCNFIPSAKISVSQDPCFWKGIGSQHGSDWIVNYVNVSGGNTCSQSPSFDGEVLPGDVKEANLSVSSLYSKNGSSMYQDVHSSLTNHASEISTTHKHYGEMNFASSPFYQNALQEVVTPSTVGSQGFELASLAQQNVRPTNHSTWIGGGNEPDVHQATYGVEANASRLNDANIASMHNKPLDGSHNWNSELAFSTSRCGRGLEAVAGECTARGLSLSLSYHHPSELDMSRLGERIGSHSLRSAGICNVSADSRSSNSSYVCSNAEVPTIYKSYGHSIQGIVGSSTYPRRSMGPLGPFTGYATILKNSKYLKPAQQLLDELCGSSGSRQVQTCEMSRRGFREVSISSDLMNVETEINGGIGGSSGVSSSFNSSGETGGEGQVGPGSRQPYQPEFHQKKAKLLYMQEEVCRRYKQYHQQMQMVISSFESVAGLSTATPYTTLALKTVSKHFRCLKSAISDQLRRISMVLGQELLSHAGATHSFEGDMTMPKLKFIDQRLQKQKSDGNRLSFLEPQQHVWRPQRGLPERAVAVLRAWLFDHFLHPYPTDTDKHMLASQTGLSRNQVSNWFINARVRVWKPMVEEMHMLETKGSSEMGLGASNSNPRSNPSCGNGRRSNLPKKSPECPAVEPIQSAGAGRNSEQWPQEDQSRMDCHVPSDVSVGLMGMVPYHQSGLGAVSLTLGLRHNTDGADHQQQQHQQERHLRRHYGAHLFQEFVG